MSLAVAGFSTAALITAAPALAWSPSLPGGFSVNAHVAGYAKCGGSDAYAITAPDGANSGYLCDQSQVNAFVSAHSTTTTATTTTTTTAATTTTTASSSGWSPSLPSGFTVNAHSPSDSGCGGGEAYAITAPDGSNSGYLCSQAAVNAFVSAHPAAATSTTTTTAAATTSATTTDATTTTTSSSTSSTSTTTTAPGTTTTPAPATTTVAGPPPITGVPSSNAGASLVVVTWNASGETLTARYGLPARSVVVYAF